MQPVLRSGCCLQQSCNLVELNITGILRGSRTNVRWRAAFARPSVTVKKKRSAATDPLMVGGTHRRSSLMQLEAAEGPRPLP